MIIIFENALNICPRDLKANNYQIKYVLKRVGVLFIKYRYQTQSSRFFVVYPLFTATGFELKSLTTDDWM